MANQGISIIGRNALDLGWYPAHLVDTEDQITATRVREGRHVCKEFLSVGISIAWQVTLVVERSAFGNLASEQSVDIRVDVLIKKSLHEAVRLSVSGAYPVGEGPPSPRSY